MSTGVPVDHQTDTDVPVSRRLVDGLPLQSGRISMNTALASSSALGIHQVVSARAALLHRIVETNGYLPGAEAARQED
jgi:hypothetical protein